MRIAMFYHSLVSDWNHGNAHFLRGLATELIDQGNELRVWEPVNGWSLSNLVANHGKAPLDHFRRTYPRLESSFYDPAEFDLDQMLDGCDLVIVHEWNERQLVKVIGTHRAAGGSYRLLFHDTHHRSVTDPEGIAGYELANYDGVLAYGRVIRDIYLQKGWSQRAWVWHEAADTRVFRPLPNSRKTGDLVWIGNWGDEERTAELEEFLIGPSRALGIRTTSFGVRYPAHVLRELSDAGIHYAGWLPNFEVPRVFSEFRVTVHVPRRPYSEALPGIPTIRPFEALACGIPLICAPWEDAEGLFKPGRDFLVARNGEEMKHHLREVLNNRDLRRSLADSGLRTIRERHTCAHRVAELMGFCRELGMAVPDRAMTA